jgi:hypothetical protein
LAISPPPKLGKVAQFTLHKQSQKFPKSSQKILSPLFWECPPQWGFLTLQKTPIEGSVFLPGKNFANFFT